MMMKQMLLGVLMMTFICHISTAQTVPQFQTTIYVEDAIGNRDSVIVGLDTLATVGIDEDFGELEFLTPFDSIFEVRAGVMDWFERDKLSKIIINRGGGPLLNSPVSGCYTTGSIFVYIWAEHQPVTVSWDQVAIQNNACVNGSLLSNHYADELASPYDWDFLPQNENHCMGAVNSFQIDISEEAVIQTDVQVPVSIEKEVAGRGEQLIYGLRFFTAPAFTGWNPCFFVTDSREVMVPQPLAIYPNPTQEQFSTQLPDGVAATTVQLFNSTGQLQQITYDSALISVRSLPAGTYFLRVVGDDARVYTGKVVKG